MASCGGKDLRSFVMASHASLAKALSSSQKSIKQRSLRPLTLSTGSNFVLSNPFPAYGDTRVPNAPTPKFSKGVRFEKVGFRFYSESHCSSTNYGKFSEHMNTLTQHNRNVTSPGHHSPGPAYEVQSHFRRTYPLPARPTRTAGLHSLYPYKNGTAMRPSSTGSTRRGISYMDGALQEKGRPVNSHTSRSWWDG